MMHVRGVILVTLGLFFGVAALILHLLAMCSPHWKITKRNRSPPMPPVSYGLWQRCEYSNITIIKQGITLGSRSDVQICWPNRYMRYSSDNFDQCYAFRRDCPVKMNKDLPKGCSCNYLPSTKALQWLAILTATLLSFGLLLLHFNTIASPQNSSALLLLSYGPFICFLLASILMVTALILVGAYLRRDAYEDFSFPLRSISNDTRSSRTFDLHSLRVYAKRHETTFSHERYVKAKQELITDANTHYHIKIGLATAYEIVATVLVIIATALLFWLGVRSRSKDIQI